MKHYTALILTCAVAAGLHAGPADHPCGQPVRAGDQVRPDQVCKTGNLLQGIHLQGNGNVINVLGKILQSIIDLESARREYPKQNFHNLTTTNLVHVGLGNWAWSWQAN